MKRTIIVLAIITIGVILIWWLLKPAVTDAPVSSSEKPQMLSAEMVSTTFFSPLTADSVVVEFSGEQAILYGVGLEGVVLNQVETASGARFENSENNTAIWKKGDEVTIYKGEEVIFLGQTRESLVNSNSNVEDVAGTGSRATTSATLTADLVGTWRWRETLMNDGTVITPREPSDFTITLKADGKINGTTDCNRFSGNYSLSDNDFLVESLAMTEMFCEDSQENDFIKIFAGNISVMLTENSELVIMLPFDSGSAIFIRES